VVGSHGEGCSAFTFVFMFSIFSDLEISIKLLMEIFANDTRPDRTGKMKGGTQE